MTADMTDRAPSPVESHDPVIRTAFKQAVVWLGLAAAMWLAWRLAQPLLLILMGLVVAAGLDGGSRLLGKIWNGPHVVRLVIVALLLAGIIGGFLFFAGSALIGQAGALGQTLEVQIARLSVAMEAWGIGPISEPSGSHGALPGLLAQLFGSIGDVTRFVGSAAGTLGSLLFIVVVGLFVAAEPRLYERGIAWLTPRHSRDRVAQTTTDIAAMLRRWVGYRFIAMLSDGIMTAIGLFLAGVPLAGLLALISGMLAFIPNFGSLFAGGIILLVGLSAGPEMAAIALGTYVIVQLIQGNLVTTAVERRAVDIAPATTLAAQLLFGALFGLMGLMLANPIVAALKVALDRPKPVA